jgi:hypothetical protein
VLCFAAIKQDRAVHVEMSAKAAFRYLASSAQSLADSLADKFVVMQGQAETGSSRQEAGLQHEATAAAVQAHTAAAEMQARGDAGGWWDPWGERGGQMKTRCLLLALLAVLWIHNSTGGHLQG